MHTNMNKYIYIHGCSYIYINAGAPPSVLAGPLAVFFPSASSASSAT